MDIRKEQFSTEAIRLLQDIADSDFIAFDFEFSGIAERNRDRASKATIQERYQETRASVQEYQPLQIGLTIVKFDEERCRYILEPYNLNISPLPLLRERQFTRKWAMNSGAISFLHKNGFDFGKQMVHGVPYLSVQEEEKARAKMTADSKREDMQLKPEDQILVQHIRDSIANWQAQPKDDQEEWLNIPHGQKAGIPTELNGYQRRLVHQIVQNEFPAMKTQGMGHFIQITNPTSDQVASQKQLEAEQRERDLARAIGFRWIIDGIIGKDLTKLPDEYLLPSLPKDTSAAEGDKPVKALKDDLNRKLKQRRKVLVGHNCMVDIMFLYKMVIGDLPETLQEFKDHVHDMFPAIVDTKFLSSCFSEKHGRLALGEVEQDLSSEPGVFPTMHTASEFGRYVNNAWLHEAGYDSYITAMVAIKMAVKLQRDGSQRKKDHDRQQQEVAIAASSSPPAFGVQEEHVTATKSIENDSSAPQQPSPLNNTTLAEPQIFTTTTTNADSTEIESREPSHSRLDSVNSTTSVVSSTLSTDSQNTNSPSSVIAVKSAHKSKSPSHTRTGSKTAGWNSQSELSALRSAFASTSIYDALDNSSNMRGEKDGNSVPEPEESLQAKTSRLLKEGRIMPRWSEEAAFWDVYGNKLQVNGTVEGVLNIMA